MEWPFVKSEFRMAKELNFKVATEESGFLFMFKLILCVRTAICLIPISGWMSFMRYDVDIKIECYDLGDRKKLLINHFDVVTCQPVKIDAKDPDERPKPMNSFPGNLSLRWKSLNAM